MSGGLIPKQPPHPVDHSTYYDVSPLVSENPRLKIAPQGLPYDTIGSQVNVDNQTGTNSATVTFDTVSQRIAVKFIDLSGILRQGSAEYLLFKFKIKRGAHTLFFFNRWLQTNQVTFGDTIPVNDVILEVGDTIICEYAYSVSAAYYIFTMQVQGGLL